MIAVAFFIAATRKPRERRAPDRFPPLLHFWTRFGFGALVAKFARRHAQACGEAFASHHDVDRRKHQ